MIVCEWKRCRKAFQPKRQGQRFCKVRCATSHRVDAYRTRQRDAKLAVISDPGTITIAGYEVCDLCGDEFLALPVRDAGGVKRLYCKSKNCREKARAMRI